MKDNIAERRRHTMKKNIGGVLSSFIAGRKV